MTGNLSFLPLNISMGGGGGEPEKIEKDGCL